MPGAPFHYATDARTGEVRLYTERGAFLGVVSPAGGSQGWRLRRRYFATLRAAAEYLTTL